MSETLNFTNFDTLRQYMTEEQCWYALYLAISKTQKDLNISFDEIDDNPAQESLFLFAMGNNLSNLLRDHLFHRPVKLEKAVTVKAADFFRIWVSDKRTLEISRYLNYLDAWNEGFPDWSKNAPLKFQNMIIVCED